MAKGRGSASKKGPKDALIEAMTHLVDEATSVAKPGSKRVVKQLGKLEKRLVAARATEAKRLTQLAAAQGSKGRKQVAKRSKQAGEAAQEVAAIAAKLANVAASAAGSAAGSVGGRVLGAAREVGSAAAQAVEAVSPVKAPAPTAATSKTVM